MKEDNSSFFLFTIYFFFANICYYQKRGIFMNMISLIKNAKEEDIDSLIDSRLSEISNKEEKEIGYNTDITCYDGFLDEKVKTNVTCEFLR